MTKRSSPLLITAVLVFIAVISVVIDYSGLLKAQLLQAPEIISTIKLVRQKTDPVQFDIYYDRLTTEQPDDVSIVIVNALIQQGKTFKNLNQAIDKVLLATGQDNLITSSTNQTLTITHINSLSTTKLGTLVTFLKRDEYISLEYDTIFQRKRVTLIDNPVPDDFPVGYHAIPNPTNELMYVRTPEFHTILGDRDRAYTKATNIPHGALLLANTLTTLQPVEELNRNTLVSQSITPEVPKLLVEQEQLVVPPLPGETLNTLIIRYRSGANVWSTSSFYLPSNQDITLPVPVKNLLDFYTDVEYSFAYVGSGFNLLNLDYPYNSLLSDKQYPVFYRTDYVSLLPELYATRQDLEFKLQVNIAPEENAIAIGILSRDPLYTLQDVVQKLQQKLPIVIFDQDSETFSTFVSKPDQLPYFNLIGKNDQIWNKKITNQEVNLISKSFARIPLVPDGDQLPELNMVSQTMGDRLLCLLKTKSGSFSLATLPKDLMLTTSCLESARRAGFTEGTLFPIVYRADKNQFEALKHYNFDASLSDQAPVVKNFDPANKNFSLNNVFINEKVKLLASPTPTFETFSTQAVELVNKNSFKLPVLPDCTISCFFKLASIIRDDDKIVLGYASDTLFVAASPLPVVDLCFSNQPLLSNLYDPGELKFQIITPTADPILMIYDKGTGCYQHVVGGDLEAAPDTTTPTTAPTPAATPAPDTTTPAPTSALPRALAQGTALKLNLNDLITDIPELPPRTIVFHTNGFNSNQIVIPPQRHYLVMKNDSIQQVLIDELVFEHASLQSDDQKEVSPLLQLSYRTTVLGQKTHLFVHERGNVILQTVGEDPYFLKTFDTTAPLNETILFPGGNNTMSIANTIRLISADEVVVQGFQDADKVVSLSLPVPERSTVKLFLENMFRPRIQVKQLIAEGVTYDPQTNFMTLDNPAGTITIPLQVSVKEPTDVSQYSKTLPPTPIPDDIDLAFFTLRLALHVDPPADVPNTSVVSPIDLDHGQAGFSYLANVTLGGIENSASYEVGDSRFLGAACGQIFKFDKTAKAISGDIPADTQLEACYFELNVKYLLKVPYAQIEVSTVRTYRIPILDNPQSTPTTPEIIDVPINADGKEVNQVISFIAPVEELVETTPEFLDKNTEAGLISALGNLTIVFDPANQKLIISGTGEQLTEPVARYLRAIRIDNGALAFLELNIFPVQQKEIAITISDGFPNIVDVPTVLRQEGFSDAELATVKITTDTLPVSVDVSDQQQVTIFGLPELQGQVFSAVLEKQVAAPSALVEFESKLKKDVEKPQPTTVRVDFKLQLSEPQTLTLAAIPLRAGKNITIDLHQFVDNTDNLAITQLPDFLSQKGTQLTGTTPVVPQDINITLQDYASVTNLIVPLKITADGPVTPPATPEPGFGYPTSPVTTDHPAAATCFPDIADQPKEYQDTICLAQKSNIIAGSKGLFNPDAPINRAEVSKVLVTGPLVIFGLLKPEEVATLNQNFTQARFTDVSPLSWYFGFVETALEVGIVSGHPDGSYRPGEALNEAEAAKMIVNTLIELSPSSFSGNASVISNTQPGDPWYAPYVRILNDNGGDLPNPNHTDELSQPISRAEFIYNLMILLDSKAKDIMAKIAGK